MKNKMIVIIALVVILFAGIIFLTKVKNDEKLNLLSSDGGNPYGTEDLHQETINLIGNDLYDNIINPEDLDKRLADKDNVTVYYFSPTCSYCVQTTPVVVPLTEEYEIEMVKMNLLEFDKREHYDIEGTPTIVHYENGIEVGRIVGGNPEDEFRRFFEEVVLKK